MIDKIENAFALLFEKLQSPKSQSGKSARDGLFTGLTWFLTQLLETIDSIDFGNFDVIIAIIIGAVIAKFNRENR